MSSQVRAPGERPAGAAMQDGNEAAARDARRAAGPEAGREAPGRTRGGARPLHPGEWETASPPPSVLYFRTLILRKPEPPTGEA